MSLSIEQILSSSDSQIEKVACPEWGGDCYVRTLTAEQVDRWDVALAEKKGNHRAVLIGMALCDENGKPLNPTDAQVLGLGQKSNRAVKRVCDVVLEMNRLRAVDLEEIEGNSKATAAPG